jgi:hypothetical protein
VGTHHLAAGVTTSAMSATVQFIVAVRDAVVAGRARGRCSAGIIDGQARRIGAIRAARGRSSPARHRYPRAGFAQIKIYSSAVARR